MDLVDVWKAAAIVLTGAFGMLGLLTEYKDPETKRITIWGRLSLAGIILSTIGGFAAQLKESSDKQQESLENSRRSLALMEKTERAVTDIGRTLTAISEPNFGLTFRMKCNDQFLAFCKRVAKANGPSHIFAAKLSDNEVMGSWPEATDVSMDLEFGFAESAAFIESIKERSTSLQSIGTLDLDFRVHFAWGESNTSGLYRKRLGGSEEELLLHVALTPNSVHRLSSGKIASVRDLPSKALFMLIRDYHALPGKRPVLEPETFELKTREGQAVTLQRLHNHVSSIQVEEASIGVKVFWIPIPSEPDGRDFSLSSDDYPWPQ